MALRRGKNLVFSENMFRKNKRAIEGNPNKSWSEIEAERGS